MGEIADRFAEAWRDYTVDGVPGSGAHDPAKGEIRALGDLLDKRLSAAIAGITTVADMAARDAFYATPANRDKLIYVNNNNGSASDPANGVYEYAVGAPRLATSLYDGLAVVVDPLVQDAKDAAGNTELISDAITGAPAALPIGNNPNDLITSVPDADNEQPFEVLIVDTNTGPAWLEANGFRRAIGRDGAGTDTVAGDLTKGKVATFQYSAGGGRFILTGVRDIEDGDRRTQVVDPDLANKPWGTVTYASGGTGARTVTTITKHVTVVGSSNAHSDYVDAAHLPANVAAAALNEFHPGGGITYVADSQAQPGAPMVTIASQLGASAAFQAGTSRNVLTMYGMNDARTLFYHDNGGIMAEIAALEAAIETIRAGGAEPVLNTIFPPDPRSSAIALDPNYYADTAAYPAGGSARAMDFPAYHAAPVSPQNHMEPRLNQLTEVRDWTGEGVARTGYKRIWHVNYLVRQLAAKYGCALLDFEFAAYRNAIETAADLGAGLDTFYDSADPLHPLMPLYDAAVTPVIRQWALAVSRGEATGRVFTGVA